LNSNRIWKWDSTFGHSTSFTIEKYLQKFSKNFNKFDDFANVPSTWNVDWEIGRLLKKAEETGCRTAHYNT